MVIHVCFYSVSCLFKVYSNVDRPLTSSNMAPAFHRRLPDSNNLNLTQWRIHGGVLVSRPVPSVEKIAEESPVFDKINLRMTKNPI